MLLQPRTSTSGGPAWRALRGIAATARRALPARRSSRLVLLLTMLASLALALPFDNWAGTNRPRPWPGGVIRYWDATGWRGTVPLAVAQWNRSGVAVRFVRARSRAEAELVVVSSSRMVERMCRRAHLTGDGNSCVGYATTIGYPGPGRVRVLLPDEPPAPATDGSAENVRLVVHELGHILGLTHRSTCASVMYRSASLRDCDRRALYTSAPSPASGLCGPFPTDVAAAQQLYGKTRRHGSRWCVGGG
jgi:hypothetical protein